MRTLFGRVSRASAVALVVVTFAARTVSAQGQPVAPLDSATSAVIAPIIAKARALGLPEAPLYAKAREGQVRRVPVANIEVAVNGLVERMRAANEALAPDATERELAAAADALHAGVPAATLRAMRKAGKDGSLAVSLGVLTSLVTRGVPVEKASMKVIELLQAGAMPNNFIALEETVRQDVAAGRRPDESLDLRLKAIFPNLPQSATTDAGLTNASTPKRPR